MNTLKTQFSEGFSEIRSEMKRESLQCFLYFLPPYALFITVV